MVVAMMPIAGLSQSQPVSDTVLQQQSQQMEQRLQEERLKLEQMEAQLNQLRTQMQSLHPSKAPPGGWAPPAGQTAQQPAAAPSPSTPSTGTNLQASTGSRKTPARSAAVQAAYQQQNALFRKGFTFYPQFQYSYSNSQNLVLNGFLAFGAIFLGNVNIARTEIDVFNWNPTLYYAINRRFELDINLPYFYERATYSATGVQFTTAETSKVHVTKWGIGDGSGGFYWQLLTQHGYWPNLIWNAQASVPTGTSPFGIKVLQDPNNTNLNFPSNLPTGKGVWGVSSGFSIVREMDPVVLYGSGNYYYEFTEHVNDISSTPGIKVPGKVAPGNALSYTLGMTLALNERLSMSTQMQDIITNTTEVQAKGAPWVAAPGSNTNAAQFSFGATYAASHNLFPFLQAAIGATQAAPNFQISLWVPYYFSF